MHPLPLHTVPMFSTGHSQLPPATESTVPRAPCKVAISQITQSGRGRGWPLLFPPSSVVGLEVTSEQMQLRIPKSATFRKDNIKSLHPHRGSETHEPAERSSQVSLPQEAAGPAPRKAGQLAREHVGRQGFLPRIPPGLPCSLPKCMCHHECQFY